MDNPLRGIAIIIASTFCFALSDAMAKYSTAALPVTEISWIRYVVFVVYAGYLLRRSHGRARVRNPSLQVVRGVMLLGSAVAFMASIQTLPLAEATTINFGSPLMIALLAIPILGEVVGPRRWFAIFSGLVGVMVVMRPGTAAFQPAALFTIASSICNAVAIVLTRKMAGVDAAATLLWSAACGLLLLTLSLPFAFVVPTLAQLALAVVVGVVSSTGQYLVILAYRHGSASLLAPFTYSQLLWATMTGYLFFSALPDKWTLVGAGIIVASGLFSARTEHRARRQVSRA